MDLSSDAAAETSPIFLNGGLLGTAIPHASCPLCWSALRASIAIGTTFVPLAE